MGPAWYSGVMNVAKNEDWRVPLEYLIDLTSTILVVSGDPPPDPYIVGLDLTGSTLKMQIRKTEVDQSAIVSISSDVGDGITITNALGGQVELLITRKKLKRLHPGDYVADLIRVDPNGFVERLWEGPCIVTEGVTR